MIKTKKLTKLYAAGEAAVRAVNGVDLEIPSGRFAALMGHSGSGKSTLLHLMGGIDRPSTGEVWLDGRCLAEMDDDALTRLRRTMLGFVFQSFNLLPGLTVEENITLPLLIAGCHNRAAQARIQTLLELTGLRERSWHRPHQLSGGEQQRVAIARALVTEPKAVLLDEPTGSLDSANSEKFLALLSQMHREFRTTIVMVTHNPSAAAHAEETIFMKDGRVAEIMARENQQHYSAEVIYQHMLAL